MNLYWQDVAPDPDGRSVPAFDETDPSAYPLPGRSTTGCSRTRGLADCACWSPSPARARAGRRGRAKDRVTRPSATRFGRFVEAVGRRYGAQVSYWSVWNEPNHPLLSRAAVRARAPVLPEALPAAVPRGAQGARALRQRARPGADGGDGAAREQQRRPPAAFVRGALCLDSSYRKRRGCGSLRRGRLGAPPVHDVEGPVVRVPAPRRVTIGSLSRLTRALDRARRAKAVRKRVDLYLTEFGVQSRPDRIVGGQREAPGRVPLDRRADRVPQPACARVLAVPAARRPAPRGQPTALRRLRVRAAPQRRRGKIAYDGFRLPLSVAERGSRTRLWGLVGPPEGGRRCASSTATAARRSGARSSATAPTRAGTGRRPRPRARDARTECAGASPAGTGTRVPGLG